MMYFKPMLNVYITTTNGQIFQQDGLNSWDAFISFTTFGCGAFPKVIM